jgi:hypothetical protein
LRERNIGGNDAIPRHHRRLIFLCLWDPIPIPAFNSPIISAQIAFGASSG